MRALVPHAAHLWEYIDARPTHATYQVWERERIAVFGDGVTQLRINHTDGYIDDFMGSALGRRRAFAIAAVHRAFIGEGGANFPLKASKECLPAPSMVALGGLIDLDPKTATLSAERVERYSAQTHEVLESPRYDLVAFHQWSSRLVSAAQWRSTQCGTQTSLWLVYGHFWSLLRFPGEAKIINLVATDFFLFGPGRARREQPNAGLHLGVRAFVRSVSHVKVLVASLFGLFGDFAFHTAPP